MPHRTRLNDTGQCGHRLLSRRATRALYAHITHTKAWLIIELLVIFGLPAKGVNQPYTPALLVAAAAPLSSPRGFCLLYPLLFRSRLQAQRHISRGKLPDTLVVESCPSMTNKVRSTWRYTVLGRFWPAGGFLKVSTRVFQCELIVVVWDEGWESDLEPWWFWSVIWI